ncbi:MAG: universal stress protein [Solirubrobacterales bacterium]|nr:universal stress protein [Solirubrobacterales bacterium]
MKRDHILVVFDDSSAGRRALEEATAIADERQAELSVVAMVDYDTRQIGCCVPAGYWNGVLKDLARDELDTARELVGERRGTTSFDIAAGTGTKGIEQATSRLGCDLVVVPRHGAFGRLALRRMRRHVHADVIGVPA